MGFHNIAINYIFLGHEGLQHYTLMITDAISTDNQRFALGIQSITSSLRTPLSMKQASNLTMHHTAHVLRLGRTKPESIALFYILDID